MKEVKQIRYIFRGDSGREALERLRNYGVEDLSVYKLWQLEFYANHPYPWPYCVKLFEEYEAYSKTDKETSFDFWFTFLSNRDADNSNFTDDWPDFIDFAYGESLDTEIDEFGDLVDIEC